MDEPFKKEIKKLKLIIEKMSDKNFMVEEILRLKKENDNLKKENIKLTSQVEEYKWQEFYKKVGEVKII